MAAMDWKEPGLTGAQTAEPSLKLRRVWTAIGIGLVALVVALSLTPRPIDFGVEEGDKLGHLLAYFTLMFWHAQLHPDRHARLALAVAFVLLGVGIEIVQGLTGYRTGDVVDALVNTLGVAVGWAAAPPRTRHALAWAERLVYGKG